MAVLYNLEPLEAMDIFYGGKTNGVSPDHFTELREKTGFEIPPLLRGFLEKYAYLDVNKGQLKFFHPDDIYVTEAFFEDGDVYVMAVGVSTGNIIGMGSRAVETIKQLDFESQVIGVVLDSDDLSIVYGHVINGNVTWKMSFTETLSGIFRMMFLGALKNMDRYVFEDKAIDPVLKTHGAERSRIMPSDGNVQRHSISYDEDRHTFLVAEFDFNDDECITILQVIPHIGEK